jgi:hypothetical protein
MHSKRITMKKEEVVETIYIYICIWRERLYLKEIMDDLHSDTQSAYQAMVYIVT